ncbi:MAG: hypothetical protein AB1638_04550, partial [Nitrospirota bacterium]
NGHPELVEGWSEGRAFRVDTLPSAGLKDAVKGSVNEYLKNEWIVKTEEDFHIQSARAHINGV